MPAHSCCCKSYLQEWKKFPDALSKVLIAEGSLGKKHPRKHKLEVYVAAIPVQLGPKSKRKKRKAARRRAIARAKRYRVCTLPTAELAVS